ncbi:hypothetical protein LUZ60_007949 [Juncus effusus]|nr:hypothetical protein LUZ60_007949 [Juncus effusus]
MKLLGWMHRKLKQNPSDVFKDFTGGGTCTCLTGRPSLDEPPFHNQYETFLGLSAASFPQQGTEQDLFSDTFLSIGTLGLLSPPLQENDENHNATGSDTPLFSLPSHLESEETYAPSEVVTDEVMEEKVAVSMVEAIAEKAAEATTESDLMAVTTELEKALAAVAAAEEKDITSCVSSARPSGGISCPLQGFLFGSPVVDHLTMEGEGREKRASLGELFMRTRMAEVAEEVAEEGGEKVEDKSKVAIGLKKMMGLRGGSRGSSGTTDGNKFQKILQIFHRKVYPETSTTNKTKKSGTKNKKRETNKDQSGLIFSKNKSRSEMANGSTNIDNLRDSAVKECLPIFHCCSNRSFDGVGVDENQIGTGDGGHWIKTDADYLVLEL